MNWIILDSPGIIPEIKSISEIERVFIFIHSPRNSINYVVKFLLEREWNSGEMNMKTYIVNIDNNNDLSAEIEKEFGTGIEFPQALIIEKGKTVFNASYGRILFSELKKFSN